MESSPTLEKFYQAAAAIRHAEDRLRSMASAFYRTGNRHVADELGEIALDLTNARDKTDKGLSEMLDGRLRDAKQFSANMLGLAVALLDRKDKVDDSHPSGKCVAWADGCPVCGDHLHQGG